MFVLTWEGVASAFMFGEFSFENKTPTTFALTAGAGDSVVEEEAMAQWLQH